MQTISDFFKHYKKHNGFPYNPNNDYYREFDELAYYMNWNQRAYDKNEKQFLEIEDQEYGYYYEDEDYYQEDDFFDDYLNVNNMISLYEYFDYYYYEYGFDYYRISNAMKLFEELAKYMDWSKKHSHFLNNLNRISGDKAKKEYLSELFKKNKVHYNPDLNPNESFMYLSEFLGWKWRDYNKKKEKFDYLVLKLSKDEFSTLQKMYEIVKRYKLDNHREKIPKSITALKKFLRKHLFVNIYDFIADNNKSFKNLKDLTDYTWEKNYFFKLNKAKESEITKILLRPLRG